MRERDFFAHPWCRRAHRGALDDEGSGLSKVPTPPITDSHINNRIGYQQAESAALRQRLGPDLAEALLRRDRFRIEPQLEQCRHAGSARPLEGRGELLGPLDHFAMGAARLALIPAEALRDLARESVEFAFALLQTVVSRLRRTYTLFEDASLADPEHRLARQVLYLVGLGATGGNRVRLYFRLRQQDLADLLGTTPRSVITILNKWRYEGLAAFDGRTAQLTILDVDRFAVLSGAGPAPAQP